MNLKKKLESITSNSTSNWLKKVESRNSKRWLRAYSSEIARRVIFLLKEKGMSQLDLADALKVKPQRVNKIVKGEENLTLETIFKLSDALEFQLITFPKYGWSYSQKPNIEYISFSRARTNDFTEIDDNVSIENYKTFWTMKGDLSPYKNWNTNSEFILEAEIVKEIIE